jgi:mannose-6-phosphate isomerase-like protein (cupin superfamily)
MKKTLDLRKVFGVILSFESEQNPSEPFEMEMQLVPGGRSALHAHPRQQESYDVKEGELEIYLNGTWNTVKAAQQILIPEASKHAFRNFGTKNVIALNKHIPGLRTEEYFETMQRLMNEGKITGRTGFRNSIYLSLHTVKYADVLKLYQPPNILIKAAAIVGRVFGYKI